MLYLLEQIFFFRGARKGCKKKEVETYYGSAGLNNFFVSYVSLPRCDWGGGMG